MGQRKRIDKVRVAQERLLGDCYKLLLLDHDQRINFNIVCVIPYLGGG